MIRALKKPREVIERNGLNEDTRDLVGKLLDMEKDKDRIYWVRVGLEEGVKEEDISKSQIYSRIMLKENFTSLSEFRAYLFHNSIEIDSEDKIAISTEKNYAFLHHNVLAEFITPQESK
jgi:hypothetical protein